MHDEACDQFQCLSFVITCISAFVRCVISFALGLCKCCRMNTEIDLLINAVMRNKGVVGLYCVQLRHTLLP